MRQPRVACRVVCTGPVCAAGHPAANGTPTVMNPVNEEPSCVGELLAVLGMALEVGMNRKRQRALVRAA